MSSRRFFDMCKLAAAGAVGLLPVFFVVSDRVSTECGQTLLIISDDGTDPDDELAKVVMAGMRRFGKEELGKAMGFECSNVDFDPYYVATMHPTKIRTHYATNFANLLGLLPDNRSVGEGSHIRPNQEWNSKVTAKSVRIDDGTTPEQMCKLSQKLFQQVEIQEGAKVDQASPSPLGSPWCKPSESEVKDGYKVLMEGLESATTATVVLLAGMRDFQVLLEQIHVQEKQALLTKIERVVFMGNAQKISVEFCTNERNKLADQKKHLDAYLDKACQQVEGKSGEKPAMLQIEDGTYIVPLQRDANYGFDMDAAFCVSSVSATLPSVKEVIFLSQMAAGNAKSQLSLYNEFKKSSNIAAINLGHRRFSSLPHLFVSILRGEKPAFLDWKWFLSSFVRNAKEQIKVDYEDKAQEIVYRTRLPADDALHLDVEEAAGALYHILRASGEVKEYDPLAQIAATPELRQKIFGPDEAVCELPGNLCGTVEGKKIMVYGMSAGETFTDNARVQECFFCLLMAGFSDGGHLEALMQERCEKCFGPSQSPKQVTAAPETSFSGVSLQTKITDGDCKTAREQQKITDEDVREQQKNKKYTAPNKVPDGDQAWLRDACCNEACTYPEAEKLGLLREFCCNVNCAEHTEHGEENPVDESMPWYKPDNLCSGTQVSDCGGGDGFQCYARVADYTCNNGICGMCRFEEDTCRQSKLPCTEPIRIVFSLTVTAEGNASKSVQLTPRAVLQRQSFQANAILHNVEADYAHDIVLDGLWKDKLKLCWEGRGDLEDCMTNDFLNDATFSAEQCSVKDGSWNCSLCDPFQRGEQNAAVGDKCRDKHALRILHVKVPAGTNFWNPPPFAELDEINKFTKDCSTGDANETCPEMMAGLAKKLKMLPEKPGGGGSGGTSDIRCQMKPEATSETQTSFNCKLSRRQKTAVEAFAPPEIANYEPEANLTADDLRARYNSYFAKRGIFLYTAASISSVAAYQAQLYDLLPKEVAAETNLREVEERVREVEKQKAGRQWMTEAKRTFNPANCIKSELGIPMCVVSSNR